MKMRAIQTLALGLLAVAVTSQAQQPTTLPATAQNPSIAPGAQQTTPAKPTAPPQDPTATTSTTPAPPAVAKEDKSVNADQQSKTTGQAQQSQLPQSDQSTASLDTGGLSSAEIQQKIEAALRNEPTLSGSNLTVNVTDDTINVSGTVASGKDRTTASRIVQSFGENRKVKEKINVSGVKK
jgi:BON domain